MRGLVRGVVLVREVLLEGVVFGERGLIRGDGLW